MNVALESWKNTTSNTTRIKELLARLGPLSSREISEETGLSLNSLSQALRRMRVKNQRGKEVYISGWIKESDSDNYITKQCHAVYDLGDLPCKPKPPRASKSELNKAYRQRNKGAINSVFALATPPSKLHSIFNDTRRQSQSKD